MLIVPPKYHTTNAHAASIRGWPPWSVWCRSKNTGDSQRSYVGLRPFGLNPNKRHTSRCSAVFFGFMGGRKRPRAQFFGRPGDSPVPVPTVEVVPSQQGTVIGRPRADMGRPPNSFFVPHPARLEMLLDLQHKHHLCSNGALLHALSLSLLALSLFFLFFMCFEL